MRRAIAFALVGALAFGSAGLAGCGQQQPAAQQAAEQQPAAEQQADEKAAPGTTVTLADGTYDIEVETDSSMFRSQACKLEVKDGAYTAHLTLPGEGFSRLYFGSAEDATADEAIVYDYRLDDEGKYVFDLPVPALDEELSIAAYGQRRDTWYDHTIVFHAPSA